MTLFGMLRTGSRGLSQNQQGLANAAKNVSGANVEGYSRRVLTPSQSQPDGLGGNPRRVIDSFVEKRMLGANSARSEAAAERLGASALDEIFSESEGGLGQTIDAFQAAMQDFSAQPSDSTTRQVLLSRATQMGQAFQRASGAIDAARESANERITDAVGQVNSRLGPIASLGKAIQRAEVDGTEASDLRDQRDKLVKEVSGFVPVTVLTGQDGSTTLTLAGGQSLVSNDGQVSPLTAQRDGTGNVRVFKKSAGLMVDVSDSLETGEIRGHMTARDSHLTDAAKKLDQLAFDVASAYNAVHEEGVGEDGVGGRALFEQPNDVTGAAASFAVAAEIDAPEKLAAAADVASLPSGNAVAKRMQALASAAIAFGGGMTATEALASLVGSVGVAIESATTRQTMAEANLTQVESMRDAVSAVSSDEEMVTMMRYQRGYEASLKVVQIADQLLEQLVNLR